MLPQVSVFGLTVNIHRRKLCSPVVISIVMLVEGKEFIASGLKCVIW